VHNGERLAGIDMLTKLDELRQTNLAVNLVLGPAPAAAQADDRQTDCPAIDARNTTRTRRDNWQDNWRMPQITAGSVEQVTRAA
jgi:hypothetical protein